VRGRLLDLFARNEQFPDLRGRVTRFEFGPPVGFTVQFRVIGPDTAQVREIAYRVRDTVRASPLVRDTQLDWNEQVRAVRVQLDQDKARVLGVTSADVAAMTQLVMSGAPVTQIRRGEELIDVTWRAAPAERLALERLGDINLFTRRHTLMAQSALNSETDFLERAPHARRRLGQAQTRRARPWHQPEPAGYSPLVSSAPRTAAHSASEASPLNASSSIMKRATICALSWACKAAFCAGSRCGPISNVNRRTPLPSRRTAARSDSFHCGYQVERHHQNVFDDRELQLDLVGRSGRPIHVLPHRGVVARGHALVEVRGRQRLHELDDGQRVETQRGAADRRGLGQANPAFCDQTLDDLKLAVGRPLLHEQPRPGCLKSASCLTSVCGVRASNLKAGHRVASCVSDSQGCRL